MEMEQTHCYATGTVTLLWKRNRVHRLCHQGNPKYVTIYIYTYIHFSVSHNLLASCAGLPSACYGPSALHAVY
jgi:hypothetical protein